MLQVYALPALFLLLLTVAQSDDSGSEPSLLYEQLAAEPSDSGILWHDLQITTANDMPILQECSGVLRNGELVGLLGPSGAGKSTLLSALAGLTTLQQSGVVERYTTTQNNAKLLHGQIAADQVASLQQHDDFFSQLTVWETLSLAAYLELPELPKREREELIGQTIHQLGLQGAMHRQIGDPSQQQGGSSMLRLPQWWKKPKTPVQSSNSGRLSGGERRRLSVALELLTDKQLLIADEPTSGLDSAYAATVMKLLQDLAQSRQIPAVCSLHSPRSSIWNRLDGILLLAPGGRLCYAGPRADAVDYFHQLGFALPAHTNPAEFLVDLVSIDSDDEVQAEVDKMRIEKLAKSFHEHQRREWKRKADKNVVVEQVQEEGTLLQQIMEHRRTPRKWIRWIPRLGALLRRSWRQNVRDVPLNVIRVIMSVGNALLLAGIFPTVAGPIPYVNSIADRVALLSFGAINLCMIAYMKAVTLFAQERPIVMREQTRQHYRSWEYLAAKCIAELPIDVSMSAIFTTTLKQYSGLQISWAKLTSVFSLLTLAGASLGFLLGSVAPTDQYASTAGIPVLVLLMVVGIINPSGVDITKTKPLVVRLFKQVSPFAFAIEALCLGEYPGIVFKLKEGGFFSRLRSAPRMGGLALIQNGDQVIEALGMQGQTFEAAMKHLGLISLGNLFLSWVGLMVQQRQQQLVRSKPKQTADQTATLAASLGQSVKGGVGVPLRVPNRVPVRI